MHSYLTSVHKGKLFWQSFYAYVFRLKFSLLTVIQNIAFCCTRAQLHKTHLNNFTFFTNQKVTLVMAPCFSGIPSLTFHSEPSASHPTPTSTSRSSESTLLQKPMACRQKYYESAHGLARKTWHLSALKCQLSSRERGETLLNAAPCLCTQHLALALPPHLCSGFLSCLK